MSKKRLKIKWAGTCECCEGSSYHGYYIDGAELCRFCLEKINRVMEPDDISKETLEPYMKYLKEQRQYFLANRYKYDTLTTLKRIYTSKDYSTTDTIAPTDTYKWDGEKWVETKDRPILLMEFQQFYVMIFTETLRIISKFDPVIYDFANRGFSADTRFYHSNSRIISSGNEYFMFWGEQIYKVDGQIKTQVIMGRMLAMVNVTNILIPENNNFRSERKATPLKDWIYYWAFAQAFKERYNAGETTLKDVTVSIYKILYQTVQKYDAEYSNSSNNSSDEQQSNFDSNTSNNAAEEEMTAARQIMELDRNYTLKELKKKRNELLKKYHPDNAGTDMQKFSEYSMKTQMINEAYDLLVKDAK